MRFILLNIISFVIFVAFVHGDNNCQATIANEIQNIRQEFDSRLASVQRTATTCSDNVDVERDLFITVDNEIELFIDGVPNPVNRDPSAKDWTVTKRVKVPAGSRVLAIKATDRGRWAGLLASITGDTLLSDTLWKVSTVEADGWTSPNFDDSRWEPATELGRHGVEPWKSRSNISTNAKWIWTRTSYYEDMTTHTVYFRVQLGYPNPNGWAFLPSVQKYYRVIFELVDWDTADARCRELGSKSHLIVVNDAVENQAIRGFLSSIDARLSRICTAPKVLYTPGYGGYWTSGQRSDRTQCGSTPWVWKPYPGTALPVTFSDFSLGQPNCGWGTEQCFHYGTDWFLNFKWNDLNCAWPACPLCELDI